MYRRIRLQLPLRISFIRNLVARRCVSMGMIHPIADNCEPRLIRASSSGLPDNSLIFARHQIRRGRSLACACANPANLSTPGTRGKNDGFRNSAKMLRSSDDSTSVRGNFQGDERSTDREITSVVIVVLSSSSSVVVAAARGSTRQTESAASDLVGDNVTTSNKKTS